jgi:hypothetical protein
LRFASSGASAITPSTDGTVGWRNSELVRFAELKPIDTTEFLTMLQGAGVESVKLPPLSPNLNAYAERFVRSITESCLKRMILFGEESLRVTIRNFVAHYHSERNHQGLANRLILPEGGHLGNTGTIQRRQR